MARHRHLFLRRLGGAGVVLMEGMGGFAMTALGIVQTLACLSTPADEFKPEGYASLEDYEDQISSDRMEDDARVLWEMIAEARKVLALTEPREVLS